MRFEWDEEKRRTNLSKHGLDFIDAAEVFGGETVSFLDDQFDYAETRFVSIGILDGVVMVIIHTEDDETVRLISFRRATPREEANYYENIRN